jgi:HlyD family secretion protein
MKRGLVILILLAGAAAAVWLWTGRSAPPEAPFTRVARTTLVSLITTNGRVEPRERHTVRAETAGLIVRVHVEAGRNVSAGAAILDITVPGAEAEVASARARLEAARAALATLERGGPARDLAAIDAALAPLKVEREAAARDIASLERLVKQQAATRTELEAAQDRLARLDADIAAQQSRRPALVERDEGVPARARVDEAAAALALAERRAAQRVLRAPAAGVIYELAVRPGEWVTPGALVARIGRLDPVEALVYVDEPDLGRLKPGLEVRLSWDALPGRTWPGRLDRVPSRVAPLGSRQVGEALVVAANADHALPPGANINAEIRAETVENALAVPKEALQRNGPATGVYVLVGGALAWRPVRTGVSTVTHAQIVEGLAEGDAVALPGGPALAPGVAVTPVYR